MINGITYTEILDGFDYGTYVNFVPDEVFWHKASLKNNKISYNDYLKKFPQGFYREEANLRLQEFIRLEQEELQRIFALDYQAYERAKNINSIDSYQGYLNKFPQGCYYNEAHATLITLQDRKAFKGAKKSNTIYSYIDYLHKFQEGAYRNEAEFNLRKLEELAEKKRIEDELQEDRESCKLEKEKLKKDIKKQVFYLIGGGIVISIVFAFSYFFQDYALMGFLGASILITLIESYSFFDEYEAGLGWILLGLAIIQLLVYFYSKLHQEMLVFYLWIFIVGLFIAFVFLAKDIYVNVKNYRSWHKKLISLN